MKLPPFTVRAGSAVLLCSLLCAVDLAAQSGGDVLRPGRGGGRIIDEPSAPLVWYLGVDAGITWSTFMNGPISYYTPNPYFPPSLLYDYLDFALPATVDEGSGLGFAVGATLDLALTPSFGLQLRGLYNRRAGSFDETVDMLEIHPETSTMLTTVTRDKTEWTFDYVNVDLLARIQLAPESFYLLIGPSIGFLAGNQAALTQEIVQPFDIYYQEANYQTTPTERELKTASMSHEISGFSGTRVDLRAGVGTWIPISEGLYLTPELTLSYPLTKMVSAAVPSAQELPEAALFPRINSSGVQLAPQNDSFNMMTIMFTLGLRWQMQ